jgi:uncharacterized membrane protein (UPF0182 family)
MAPRAFPIPVSIDREGGLPPEVEEIVQRVRGRSGPWLDRAILWGSVAIAFVFGTSMSERWEEFRLALAGVPFGYTDPQFGLDVGFFVFRLPALRSIADWTFSLLVLTTVLTLLVHVVDGAIQPWAKLKGFAPHVKAHLSVLLALIVLSRGFGYWLDIYELDFSPRGLVTGASYTDVNAQLPAFRILIIISVVAAVILLLNIRFKGWRLPLIALGVWVGASILLGWAWPGLMQRFVVTPNEVALEAPFIERNIEMTRRAFGLSDVVGRAFPAAETLSAEGVLKNRRTLVNVRLWDPRITVDAYEQLQAIRPYYEFADVDVDRYVVDGTRRQVILAAREMDTSQLPEQAQTWVNQHLVYTHGFGIVMSPVNESDNRGLPKFIIGDVPPRTDTDLVTEQGRIYFGEITNDYVIVDSGIKEFDYPLGDANAEYEYEGDTGIRIGSLPRRLAWAWHLGSSQILFSGFVEPDSRVLYRRDLMTRLNRLAPWLLYEEDEYPVLTDGRIEWLVDAYTATEDFPYSQPLDSGISYLRNSVKVTVDAYDGTTTLFAFDPEDPILRSWRKIFPTLFTDGEKIPGEIREHFRYPQGLFSAQALVYENYHMTDPRVFYNKEDSWAIPGERQGTPMEPFYVLMELPGDPEEDFLMMLPFTPRNRDNMIGWMAAKSDPERYGERTVYQFPKERVVLGPEQVAARINADQVISPQLSLWNQRGSQAIFGNMLVIPIEESIVYIQPLYLQAEQTQIPSLTRVIVVYADKVEMERTLEGALLKVFGEGAPEPPDAGVATADVDPGELAAEAQRAYEEAVEAQRQGDWTTYGQKLQELGRLLGRLSGETSPSAGAEATPTP